MKNKLLIQISMVCLLCPRPTMAQNSDWSRVQGLQSGTPIVVTTRHSFVCGFVSADLDSLVCETHMSSIRIERPRISRIRISHPESSMAIGAAIGAAAGAGAGAAAGSDEKDKKSTHVLVGGGLGAGIGAIIGAVVGHTHGRTIYVRH